MGPRVTRAWAAARAGPPFALRAPPTPRRRWPPPAGRRRRRPANARRPPPAAGAHRARERAQGADRVPRGADQRDAAAARLPGGGRRRGAVGVGGRPRAAAAAAAGQGRRGRGRLRGWRRGGRRAGRSASGRRRRRARGRAAHQSRLAGAPPASALAAAAAARGVNVDAAAAVPAPGWAKVLGAMIEEEGAPALLARFSNYPRDATGRLARTYTEEVAAPLFRRAWGGGWAKQACAAPRACALRRASACGPSSVGVGGWGLGQRSMRAHAAFKMPPCPNARAYHLRLWSGAPAATPAADRERLKALTDANMAHWSIILVASPESLVALNVIQLDTLDTISVQTGPDHWLSMVEQMRLTRRQARARRVGPAAAGQGCVHALPSSAGPHAPALPTPMPTSPLPFARAAPVHDHAAGPVRCAHQVPRATPHGAAAAAGGLRSRHRGAVGRDARPGVRAGARGAARRLARGGGRGPGDFGRALPRGAQVPASARARAKPRAAPACPPALHPSPLPRRWSSFGQS